MMETRLLKVMINNVSVYEETVFADRSMMRGHQLRKKFFIDSIKSNGIWAGVFQFTENGGTEVHDVHIDGGEMVLQSKMNNEDFPDTLDWFDEKLYKKK